MSLFTIDCGFRYEIVRKIVEGGMGIVYEAEQTPLGRRVALKVLRGSAALDARALARFQVEAQAASLLSHPHIVPVHAFGRIGDVSYYTMPLIDGASLDRVIASVRTLVGLDPGSDEADPNTSFRSRLARGAPGRS